MDNDASEDNTIKATIKEGTSKDLNQPRSSIKSTKSLEKNINSSTGSLRSEKDVHFAKDTLTSKSVSPDHTLTVSHKIITNWRNACSKTKDRTKDLLKRWRTLPEYEDEDNKKKMSNLDNKGECHQNGSGWSVHVWSNFLV